LERNLLIQCDDNPADFQVATFEQYRARTNLDLNLLTKMPLAVDEWASVNATGYVTLLFAPLRDLKRLHRIVSPFNRKDLQYIFSPPRRRDSMQNPNP
jgi:hypothetical protein